jgi:DNA-directed RNA polymerase specialized sigma24 family protein
MNIAQIALVMRRTQTHVKVLLFRARQALSGELSPQSYQKESPIMHAAFISPL